MGKRDDSLICLEHALQEVVADARLFEERYRVQLEQLDPSQVASGLNLLHYLALRRRDVREVQEALSSFGLSSLGRAESHVLDQVHAVIHAVRALQGQAARCTRGPITHAQGNKLLARHTRALLGRKLRGSSARIMVTLPVEMADQPRAVRDLVAAGMNCARINCAQGGPAEWEQLLAHVHAARARTGRSCRTFMDLAGPKIRTGAVTELPSNAAGPPDAKGPAIILHTGDTLIVHGDPRPGEPAVPAPDGQPALPAHVSCTLPACLDHVRPGEALALDDGKAWGVIREVRSGEIAVEIVQARPGGMKLRANKGINLPESRLRIAGLTERDKTDLRFVAAHADVVNVSFVNHPDDVEDLLDELEAAHGEHLGLVLKIETRGGYQNLPAILLAALEWPVVGVMIARGDLAVEVGWTHLGRIQEEILRVCEAAHVPVVWATEVLDRLAKKGMPTRAEISDVVLGERAECVMLNKGPYIVDAIRTLDCVLRSVEDQQRKKTTLLPPLTLEEPDPLEVGRAVGLRQGRWT